MVGGKRGGRRVVVSMLDDGENAETFLFPTPSPPGPPPLIDIPQASSATSMKTSLSMSRGTFSHCSRVRLMSAGLSCVSWA